MSPNATCDLHLHTHYSDGGASPAALLYHAASLGLRTVSITDHNTIAGLGEASNVANSLGIELVPGIEVSTFWRGCPDYDIHKDVDVLGYFFNPASRAFQDFCRQALDDLIERTRLACEAITSSGFEVTIYDLQDENPRFPGPTQLISALQRKRLVTSAGEALDLLNRNWENVRRSRILIEDAIQAIHKAGGVAILAHPVAINCDGWLQEEHIAGLVASGLDGLEVYHPRLSGEARQHFLELASRSNLLVSGGSDEHGSEGEFSRMGSELVTYEMVNALRLASQRYPARA